MANKEVERLRGLVRDCMTKHLYPSAIFYGNMVATIEGSPTDAYMLAQALYLAHDYRRALHVLDKSNLIPENLEFRFLAAQCLESLKEWQQCLTILGEADVDEHGNVQPLQDQLGNKEEGQALNVVAAMHFLRGKAYDALENHVKALNWYKAAIMVDPYFYEVFEYLVDNYRLTFNEESNLLSSLVFEKESGWLSSFYSCLIMKHDKAEAIESMFSKLEKEVGDIKFEEASSRSPFESNVDMIAYKARSYYHCGEYQKCFDLTMSILERDPFHLKGLLVHIAVAVELGHKNDLYVMSSHLSRDYPQKALAWFAIACYYYCTENFHESRRYFSKATSIEGRFVLAWIGLGNAFAVREEGDQAMAAFRRSSRLFPGCHLPILYIGLEYRRIHNFKLAEQFLMQAKQICSTDPLIYHELGVVAYQNNEYEKALSWFEKTLGYAPSTLTKTWEPTLVNKAHTLRKLKHYGEAIKVYEDVLNSFPKSVSTYAGLGYTYHLQGVYTTAIEIYHEALYLKADDPFTCEMLHIALIDSSKSDTY